MSDVSNSKNLDKFSIFKSIWEVVDPSLILILTGAFAFSLRSRIGIFDVNTQTISSVVFQVSGTMVALALPAAQLSYSLVANFEEGARRIWNEKGVSLEKQNNAISGLNAEVRNQLFPAWRAVIYVFIGFVLSAFSMILPPDNLTTDYFLFDDFFAIASLLFVIVGSYWFYPTAKHAFGLKELDKYPDLINSISQLSKLSTTSPSHAGANIKTTTNEGINAPETPEVKPEST